MKTINVLGKPCPIPVIEAKKALAEESVNAVLVLVDNITAAQNLEKMANGYGYGYSRAEKAKDLFEVSISRDGKPVPKASAGAALEPAVAAGQGFAVAIGRDTMGDGARELGQILIKGFIYSLTELEVPPKCVIFFNSGAKLTAAGANTVEDIKKLEDRGVEIITCGTCVNYYKLEDKLAVGSIANMYGIAERMAAAGKVINI